MRQLWSRAALAFALAVFGFVDLANAQNYPNRPIRLVVPFAAGGGADSVGRILAKRLSETLGQQVVVENRLGAAGNIAAEYVMNAEPDGYTLLQAGATSINMAVFENLKFDLLRDFAPVSMTAYYPY